MPAWPHDSGRPPTRIDRARLSRWLRARSIDGAMLPEPCPGPISYEAPSPIPPRVGQVRLLFPCLPPARERPLFYAVLQSLKDRVFLVAPFSRFEEPATAGEMLTGKRCPALKVLCLWNAWTVPAPLLRLSWPASRLSLPQRRDAARWLALQESGAPPSPALAGRLGPPLRHPRDPRMDYLDEERMRWRTAWKPDELLPETAFAGPAAALSLAAEPRCGYRPSSVPPPDEEG